MTPPPDPLSLHLPLCIAQAMTAAADCAADSTTANPARVPWRGGTHGCSPGAGAPLARRPGQAPAAAIPARRPLHGRPPGAAAWAGLAGCATSNFYLLFTYTCFFSHPHQQVRIRLVSLFFCAQFMQLSLCTIDSL